MKYPFRTGLSLLLLLAACFHPTPSYSASGTWTSVANGTWADSFNWAGGNVANGIDGTADFNSVDVPAGSITVSLAIPRTIGNLIFGDTDPVTTPGTWVIDNNGLPANVLTLQTSSGIPTITTNVDALISAIISGTNGLSKGGVATLTLSATNTYSGGTTVTSGTMNVTSGARLGSGNLAFTGTSGASSVILNSGQAITTLSSPTNAANTLILAGTGAILTINQSSNTTFGGVISGTGGGITKIGSNTLTLSGSNTYTGPTVLSSGTLRLDLGTASGNGTAGGTIQVIRSANTITMGGGTITTVAGNGTGSTAYLGTFSNLTLIPGASSFTQNRGSSSRAINTFNGVTHSVGGTVNLTDVLNADGTSNSNTGGYRAPTSLLLSGVVPYMTYTTRTDGTNAITSWFVPAGTSNNGSAYSAFTSTAVTTPSSSTSANNFDVLSSGTAGTAAVVNTLRFNDTASSRTITILDTMTVSAGGVLVTNRSGNHTSTITGGILTGSSGADLMIIDYDDPANGASAFMQIDSIVADNTSATALTKSGIGTLILTNTGNTYTGKTYLNGGITNIAAGTSLGAIPGAVVADQLTFHGGTLQFASSFDLSPNRGITLNSNGGTLDTQGNSTAYSGIITGSGPLAKSGTGTLTLTGSNTYTGNTTVGAGTLKVNNDGGSATGTGAVTVSAGATLTGTGIISGNVTLASGAGSGAGGHIAPGNGVGTLTVGSITFSNNSALDLEFGSGVNDLLNVTTNGGVTINGGGFNLYSAGTTNKFLTTGTYNFLSFAGSLGGTGLAAWTSASILNPDASLNYAFGTSGGFITLAITGVPSVTGTWTGASGSSWATPGNWTGNVVPNSTGATADFFGATPTAVTLDGNKTIGVLEFGGTNSYTIASGTGGSLLIDNGTFKGQINVSGSHSILVPVALSGSNAEITVTGATDFLTVTGVVSGTAATVSKSGAGTLALTSSNTYAGGTTLNSGTIQLGDNAALSSGTVTATGTSAIQSGTNNLTVANKFVINSGAALTADTQGNDLTLIGLLSGSGRFLKSGTGRLTLTQNNSYGATTINSGILQVGIGGVTGSLGTGTVTNNGSLVFNRSDIVTESIAINGTGDLTQAGSGTTILAAAGTMSGSTFVTSGTLELANTLALQNSTVVLNNPAGAFSFGSLTAATLGGLSGSQSLALTNTASAAVALTVGGNNLANTYSGNLSGGGSLLKTGTGTLFLTGTSTHTGLTSGTGGTIEIGAGGSLGSSSNTVTMTNNSLLRVNGGTVTLNTLNLQGQSNSAGLGGRMTVEAGSTVTIATSRITGNNQNSISSTLIVNGGNVSLGAYSSDRDGTSSADTGKGLIINGGTVTANSVVLSTGNSWSNFTVNGGSMVIGGTSSSNAFLVGNGGSAGRGGNLTVTGGSLLYNGTDGMILNALSTATDVGQATFSGGVTTLPGIIMNGPSVTTGTASLTVSGGTVFLGGNGIVQNIAGGATALITLTSGTLGATADWASSANMALSSGAMTFQAADALNVAHSIALSGVLSGGGSLSKTGNGVLTISGSNTYSGGTSINAGVLQINSSASLGGASGSAAITSGTLQALNTIDTTRNFQLSGSTSTISVDNNAVYTISGTVNDGAGVGSLTKSGSGTLVLTASNGYTGGTLVAAGKLNVNGSISGSTTVSSDATIGGTGTVADVNILAGGKFAPGASIGTLTGTSLVWNSNSTASALFELSNVDNTSDSLSLSGTFSKGTGTSFVFDFQNSGFSNGVSPTVYTLASFASTTFSQGNFSFVNLGPGLAGNFILTSNVLQFSVVPEPETWALLAGATGFLWVRRRFRKR